MTWNVPSRSCAGSNKARLASNRTRPSAVSEEREGISLDLVSHLELHHEPRIRSTSRRASGTCHQPPPSLRMSRASGCQPSSPGESVQALIHQSAGHCHANHEGISSQG
jgi:hypothetical protein